MTDAAVAGRADEVAPASGGTGPGRCFDRVDALLAGALAASGLALYVRTLAPGLLLGDSGELQVLSLTPGLAHPTGCPVFLILSRLVALLPLGDPPWRVNLVSALFGALTLSVLYACGRLLTTSRWAAIIGPVCLALCQLYWWEAVMAELYTAAALMISGCVACLLLWRRGGHPGWLFAAGLLVGLSQGVHGMVVVAAPGGLLYLALTARRRADWQAVALGVATGAVLTLGSYLYLDALDPPAGYFDVVARPSTTVWGLEPGAFDSRINRLGFMISARHFRRFMFQTSLEQMRATAAMYAEFTGALFSPAALGLMAAGAAALAWRRWREAALILGGLLPMLAFILTYRIEELHAFFIPTYVLLALLASAGTGLLAEGAARLTRRLLPRMPAKEPPPPVTRWIGHIAGPAVAGLALIAVAAPFAGETLASIRERRIIFLDGTPFARQPYPVQDPRLPEREAAAIVDRLDQGAVVFADWPEIYPCIYVANVERARADLSFHMCVPDPQERLPASCLDFIRTQAARRPIYFTWTSPELVRRFPIEEIGGMPPLFRLRGSGLSAQVLRGP